MNTKLDEELTKEFILASRFIMKPHGHHMGQGRILRILKDGPISQKELQEAMNVQAGSISEIVSKLEEKGLLTKTKSDEDARAVVLTITDKGKERLEEFAQRKDFYTSISEEEKEQLKDILVKLNNDWIRRDPLPERRHHSCPPAGMMRHFKW